MTLFKHVYLLLNYALLQEITQNGCKMISTCHQCGVTAFYSTANRTCSDKAECEGYMIARKQTKSAVVLWGQFGPAAGLSVTDGVPRGGPLDKHRGSPESLLLDPSHL